MAQITFWYKANKSGGGHPHLPVVRAQLHPEPTQPDLAPLHLWSSIPRHYFFP